MIIYFVCLLSQVNALKIIAITVLVICFKRTKSIQPHF